MSFLTGASLDFYIFLTTYKHSEKFITYILDEAVHSQTTRQRDDQAERKQTFHWTTTFQAGPINQVDNNFSEEVVSTQTLALLPPPLIFEIIPKCFDTAVWTFLSFSSEPKITYISYAFNSYFFICYLADSQPILHH